MRAIVGEIEHTGGVRRERDGRLVRDARRADLPAIVDIYNSAIASRSATADVEPWHADRREGWFADHLPNRRPLWVAVDLMGDVEGWLSFQDFSGGNGYSATAEVRVYVHPRRRRSGVGAQLLDLAVDPTTGLNLRTLLAFVFTTNAPGLALFTARGFEQWGLLRGVATFDDGDIDVSVMGRHIARGATDP
ncbi:MAG TPA: GNAT family N-acetyltransferase [Acidimicrobiia bacterium]|nr:GNAT family N-acetyltransferase [Acidimicrobiia bacterium]